VANLGRLCGGLRAIAQSCLFGGQGCRPACATRACRRSLLYDHGAFFENLLRKLHGDPAAVAHGTISTAVNLHLYSRPLIRRRWCAGIARHWLPSASPGRMDRGDKRAAVRRYRQTLCARRLSRHHRPAGLVCHPGTRAQSGRGRAARGDQPHDRRADFQAGGEPFGLVRNDSTVRPAFLAYRTAATLFADASAGTIAQNHTTGVFTVTLRRKDATVTVLWDQSPTAAAVSVPVNAGTRIYDRFGLRLTPKVLLGRTTITLAGSNGNTNTADPRDYVIGGTPVIVVQRTSARQRAKFIFMPARRRRRRAGMNVQTAS